ncbi:hypothetical protein PTKIN_Ptkin15bG0014900 [Pterospermum kingtungense]
MNIYTGERKDCGSIKLGVLTGAVWGYGIFLFAKKLIQIYFQEAVERLTSMNHPDGDCPLCLLPLVSEDDHTEMLPFMKLMSCFHCFHSECIIRWWNWLQNENKNAAKDQSSVNAHLRNTGSQQVGESVGNCPVCRKVFHTKDFEHVLDLVGTHSFELNLDETEVKDDEKLLDSDLENIRRQKFEAIIKLQQENCGLIGSKADNVVLTAINPQNTVTMSNPQNTITMSNHASTMETTEQPQINTAATVETNSSSSSNRPSTNKHRNSGTRGTRKHREQNSRKQLRQWVRRDNGGGAD